MVVYVESLPGEAESDIWYKNHIIFADKLPLTLCPPSFNHQIGDIYMWKSVVGVSFMLCMFKGSTKTTLGATVRYPPDKDFSSKN